MDLNPTPDDLNDRRNHAIADLADAAHEIASAYDVCPLCLIMALYTVAERGIFMHFTERHTEDGS